MARKLPVPHRAFAGPSAKPPDPGTRRKSPSLDENNQLQLSDTEQAELDRIRCEHPNDHAEFIRSY